VRVRQCRHWNTLPQTDPRRYRTYRRCTNGLNISVVEIVRVLYSLSLPEHTLASNFIATKRVGDVARVIRRGTPSITSRIPSTEPVIHGVGDWATHHRWRCHSGGTRCPSTRSGTRAQRHGVCAVGHGHVVSICFCVDQHLLETCTALSISDCGPSWPPAAGSVLMFFFLQVDARVLMTQPSIAHNRGGTAIKCFPMFTINQCFQCATGWLASAYGE